MLFFCVNVTKEQLCGCSSLNERLFNPTAIILTLRSIHFMTSFLSLSMI